MKLKCNRAALHEAVQLASSIVPTRSTKPILSCALFTADQEMQTLAVSATDNEMTIICTVEQVQVEEGGEMVIPAARTASILFECSEENLELSWQGNICLIRGKNKSKFDIYGDDAEQFPAIDIELSDECNEIEAAVLKRMIKMTTFAAAKESSRYALNGILWELKGKDLLMVATDGRRLAKIEGKLISSVEEEKSVIVPVGAMQILEKVLDNPEEKVKVFLEENKVIFATERMKLSSNLVQGRFPRYSDVIPSGCDKKAVLNVAEFASGIRQVATMTNDTTRGMALEFTKGRLELTSSTPEAGDAEFNMEIDYDGPELKMGFNPFYILDVLKNAGVDTISLDMQDANKPGVIRIGSDFLYVIMPVAL